MNATKLWLVAVGCVLWGHASAAESLRVCLNQDAPLLEAVHAVDRHMGIRTEERTASTDANIPLSLGIPAVSIGAGGEGGGIHTRAEWYDAAGREVALKRILLLLLTLF